MAVARTIREIRRFPVKRRRDLRPLFGL